MKVTLKQIAEIAGVSITTVSRVLSGQTENIVPATRQKVLTAMSILGLPLDQIDAYRERQKSKKKNPNAPNIIYCLFRTRKVHLSPFYNNLILAVAMAAEKRQMVCQYLYGEEGIAFIRAHKAEKVIILGTQTAPGTYSTVQSHAASVVNVSGSVELPNALNQCTISVDYYAGGVVATEHLISLGHRRIGFIGGKSYMEHRRGDQPQIENRLLGFRDTMRAYNIPIEEDFVKEGEWDANCGFRSFCEMMKHKSPPTAIFAASDFIAMGVLGAANQLGMKIPEDISIIGFDNIDYSTYSAPPLTTMSVDITAIAQLSVILLKEMYESREIFSNSFLCTFKPSLLVRQSAKELGGS